MVLGSDYNKKWNSDYTSIAFFFRQTRAWQAPKGGVGAAHCSLFPEPHYKSTVTATIYTVLVYCQCIT